MSKRVPIVADKFPITWIVNPYKNCKSGTDMFFKDIRDCLFGYDIKQCEQQVYISGNGMFFHGIRSNAIRKFIQTPYGYEVYVDEYADGERPIMTVEIFLDVVKVKYCERWNCTFKDKCDITSIAHNIRSAYNNYRYNVPTEEELELMQTYASPHNECETATHVV